MYDDLALTLSISEINKRLTRNARERDRLRTMLRVAVEARDDAEKFGSATPAPTLQPEVTRPEGVRA
jgi:hypothetical protein